MSKIEMDYTDPKDIARVISRFVNGCYGTDLSDAANKMAFDHPTLQQLMFKFCVEYIKALAAKEGFIDARNEFCVAKSREILEKVPDVTFIPFI